MEDEILVKILCYFRNIESSCICILVYVVNICVLHVFATVVVLSMKTPEFSSSSS